MVRMNKNEFRNRWDRTSETITQPVTFNCEMWGCINEAGVTVQTTNAYGDPLIYRVCFGHMAHITNKES